MNRLIAIIIFSVVFSTNLIAISKTDSLLEIWNNLENADTIRLKACSQVLESYWQSKNPKIDSLLHVFGDLSFKTQNQVHKASFFSFKGLYENYRGNRDSALVYHRKALNIRKKLNRKVSCGVTYNNIGLCFAQYNLIDSAILYFQKSYDILKGTNSKSIIYCLTNCALAYSIIKQYEKSKFFSQKALEQLTDSNSISYFQMNLLYGKSIYFLGEKPQGLQLVENTFRKAKEIKNYDAAISATKVLSELHSENDNIYGKIRAIVFMKNIATKAENITLAAEALGNLAAVYSDLGDSAKVVEYCNKSLDLLQNPEHYTQFMGKGMNYTNLCYTLGFQGKLVQALKNCSLCNEMVLITKHKSLMAQNINNYGNVYKKLADSCDRKSNTADAHKYRELALNHYYSSLKLRKSINDIKGQAQTMTNLGWLYYNVSQYDSSLFYTIKALDLTKGKILREARDASELLYLIYKKTGDIEKSFEYYEFFVSTRDSINNQENNRKIAGLEYEAKYKEKILTDSLQKVKQEEKMLVLENRKQKAKNRKNRLQVSAIVILVMLLGGFITFIGRFNINKRLAQALIFIFFLLVFEFVLVIMDPFIDNWSDGEIVIKLLINSVFAILIFFGHQFFERKLKNRLFNLK